MILSAIVMLACGFNLSATGRACDSLSQSADTNVRLQLIKFINKVVNLKISVVNNDCEQATCQ